MSAAHDLFDDSLALIGSIDACPDDTALEALLPDVKTRLGEVLKPSAIGLIGTAIDRVRGDVGLGAVGRWMHEAFDAARLSDHQRATLAEQFTTKRRSIHADRQRSLFAVVGER